MGRFLSDILDCFLDNSTLSWPVKLLISLGLGIPLLVFLGDYYDYF
ncbi:hypothetical protein IV102_23230 [bacterium]|nr:hypothetical protein [bacterium]